MVFFVHKDVLESRLYKLSQSRFMSYLSHVFRDVYEGTRMATEEDLPGIRKLIYPLEESGVLVRRTDKEVCLDFEKSDIMSASFSS